MRRLGLLLVLLLISSACFGVTYYTDYAYATAVATTTTAGVSYTSSVTGGEILIPNSGNTSGVIKWSGFALPTIPAGATIQAIYAEATVSATGSAHYGPAAELIHPDTTWVPLNLANGANSLSSVMQYPATAFVTASLGTDLSLITANSVSIDTGTDATHTFTDIVISGLRFRIVYSIFDGDNAVFVTA